MCKYLKLVDFYSSNEVLQQVHRARKYKILIIKLKIAKLKEIISELESELIRILNQMGQTKGGDVSLDGNLDLNVSLDGGGTVALIVVSVLAAVGVILLIVFFSCKRGCKCCDNLCCKGRCHTTEAEKAVIEQNKKLQDDLRRMNNNLQTLQVRSSYIF